MIEALLEGGQPVEQVAELARGRMRVKRAQLCRALAAELSETSKFEIRVLLKLADELTTSISLVDQRIVEIVQPMRAEVERLLAVPGLKGVVVAAVLAEIGTNMSVFPSSERIVSWAGLSPGSRESAGKRMPAPTRRGSYWLRIFLVEAAWSAVRTRGTFWSRKYRSLVARLGPKQAIVAIARRILVAVYYILRDGVPYRELGSSYSASSDVARRVRHLVSQLRLLGKDVELKPIAMSP